MSAASASTLLEIGGLSCKFGGVYAVDDVSMVVPEGELRAVIGPNGAGKSTLFNLITGYLTPASGRVVFQGRDLGGLPPYRRAELGISIVFQGARLFRGMTVLENVMVGAHCRTRSGFIGAALRLPAQLREERRVRQEARAALDRVGLTSWAGTNAESLPWGMQRSLQVARALCGEPTLLLLDEPASGLREGERRELAGLLSALQREGLTMILIEHDVGFVMRLAETVTVLDAGSVIGEGTPIAIRNDPAVIAAYIGSTDAAA